MWIICELPVCWLFFSVSLSLVVFSVVVLITTWQKRSPGLSLPPGSMGWPWIGETHKFYSEDPNVFFATKQQRYGEIFKTHLLGYPCVMLANPEAARFVLSTQAQLFKPTYPKSKETIIGPSALFFHQGDYHSRLRKLVQGSLSPEAIRFLLPDINSRVISLLTSLEGRTVTTFHEMKNLSFDVGILAVFGRDLDDQCKEELTKYYCIAEKGYNSFPNRFPGTLYSKAVAARKKLEEIMRQLIQERRQGRMEKNLLSVLMSSQYNNGVTLSDDQIVDNVIGVLFAARDTTASAMTWIIKYLYANKKLLESIKEEHASVCRLGEGSDCWLSWEQTRKLKLTHRVIMESLRMASIISFTFREAVADVEYKGYLIPKGWKVLPLFRNIHHSAEFFPEPKKFNESRFRESPSPGTFLPFGSGVHACPGNELAKMEMIILMHHLVTKYRWEILESSSDIEYGPFPIPKGGLPAQFFRQSSKEDEQLKEIA
ncbi:abscisic acid 8'-hydroxylase 3-like [Wolffia australiana]